MAIPEKFTNKYIDNEIAKLNESISFCDQAIVSLTRTIQYAEERYKKAEEAKRNEYMRISYPEFYDMGRITYGYTQTMNAANEKIRKAIEDINRETEKKWKYETQKCELEQLRKMTEEQRAEKYNQ